MPKLIIIEGPDGVGKTTYIKNQIANSKAVCKTLEYTKKHKNTEEFWKEEIISWCMILKTNKVDTLIVSRCWHSEIIYSPIFNRTPRLRNKYTCNALDMALEAEVKNNGIDLVKLLMMPKNRQQVYNSLVARGDEPVILDKWIDIVRSYNRHFSRQLNWEELLIEHN